MTHDACERRSGFGAFVRRWCINWRSIHRKLNTIATRLDAMNMAYRAERLSIIERLKELHTTIQTLRDTLGAKLDAITESERSLRMTQQEVLDKVRAQRTVVDGLKVASDNDIAFQRDIKAKLDAAIASGGDPAQLQQIADELDQNTQGAQAVQQDLLNAVVEGTAAAGEAPTV